MCPSENEAHCTRIAVAYHTLHVKSDIGKSAADRPDETEKCGPWNPGGIAASMENELRRDRRGKRESVFVPQGFLKKQSVRPVGSSYADIR